MFVAQRTALEEIHKLSLVNYQYIYIYLYLCKYLMSCSKTNTVHLGVSLDLSMVSEQKQSGVIIVKRYNQLKNRNVSCQKVNGKTIHWYCFQFCEGFP